ncbi:MAG: universal stress protein [Chloroflexota bacterium]
MAYGKVLALLTGDPSDEGVLEQGVDMVQPIKGNLYAVYVIEVDRAVPVDAEVGQSAAYGESVLRAAESRVRLPRGDFDAQLLQARETGPAVVEEARRRRVDAVVVGTTSHYEYGRFSLTDDVMHILENAPCLVVLRREPPRHQPRRSGGQNGTRPRAARQSGPDGT